MRRDSPTRRHERNAVRGAQSPSREPTSLSALSRSITADESIASPPYRQDQRHAAQIQTGLLLHRTRSGSLESAEVSGRATWKETARRRSLERSRVPVSTAPGVTPGKMRTMRDGLGSRRGSAAARTGAGSPVLGLCSSGIGGSHPASAIDVVDQVVQGNATPFAVVTPPRLNDRAVKSSALVDQGEGSKTYNQATVLRCVFLMRLIID